MDKKQLIVCLKLLELQKQDLKDKARSFPIEEKDIKEDEIIVEMPHKSRLYFGMKSGIFLSSNRFTIKGDFLSCYAPKEQKSVFPIEAVESIHNMQPNKQQQNKQQE